MQTTQEVFEALHPLPPTRIGLVEGIIINNIDVIQSAYWEHYHRAHFKPRTIGLNAAYDRLNIILPNSVRHDLTIRECMFLNTDIKILLTKKLH